MIKTINKEYEEKRLRLEELKREILQIMASVNVKSLTLIEQGIFMLLIEEKEK